jgi:DNA-binding LacI/PurR family transcriptional regulator/DNA-binding transcriptional regulator YhcF (GntR family)
MNADSPAIVKALAYVNAVIEQMRGRGLQRLPTIRELARGAQVSHWAVSGIIGRLKDEGVVDACRSRGIMLRAADAGTAPAAIERKPLIWQQTHQQLFQDLVNGAFGFDRPLPSRKALVGRYGVSNNTLRKALHALLDDKTIAPYKHTYRISLPNPRAGRSSIMLFARGSNPGTIVDYNLRTHEYFRDLEQDCLARGIRLQVVPVYFDGPTATFAGQKDGTIANDAAKENILGFIVWRMNLPPVFTDTLLLYLRRFGKPISFFHETEPPVRAAVAGPQRLLRDFVFQSGFEAGRTVGRFLLAHGHRGACCFSAEIDADWSRDRVRGMRAEFARAGRGARVVECGCSIMGEQDARKPSPWLSVAQDRVDKAVRLVVGSAMSQQISIHLLHYMKREFIRHRMAADFRRVLEDKTTTAWVGTSDLMALECLIFLEVNKVNPPGEISVIGFDDTDTIETAAQGLTSYNFNGASAMHLMTECIVRPGSPLTKGDAQRLIVIEGFIHERATTGPVMTRQVPPRPAFS